MRITKWALLAITLVSLIMATVSPALAAEGTESESGSTQTAETDTWLAVWDQSGIHVIEEWNAPASGFQTTVTAEPTGGISGYVYQADGTTPIPHVGVVAWTWAYTEPAPVVFTDATGYYMTTGLASGQYRVMAIGGFSPGYANEFFNNTYDWNAATPVMVTAPSDTSGTNFSLDIAGSLSGNIYMADGVTPIIHFIRVLTPDLNPAGGYPMILWSGPGYTLTGLPTGSYRVQACASCSGLSYQDEWYNNASTLEDAWPIPVVSPNDIPGIDFTLDQLMLDYGDAPDSYGTLSASNGARHVISGPWLGDANDTPDAEADGQPDANALGDDFHGKNDENGVKGPGVILTINSTLGELLDNPQTFAILDKHIHQVLVDYAEVLDSQRGTAFSDLIPLMIGAGVVTDAQIQGIKDDLHALNVQTGVILTINSTLGELMNNPQTYAILDKYIHQVLVDYKDILVIYYDMAFSDLIPLMISAGIVTDAQIQGITDDLDALDVQGETLLLIKGQSHPCTIAVGGEGGWVQAWIDLNHDGQFQHPGEQILYQYLPVGANDIHGTIPVDWAVGQTYARFRISSQGGLTPYGLAPDGEVEDYKVVIIDGGASVEISVTLQGSSRPDPVGWQIPLTIRTFNPGANVLTDAPLGQITVTTSKDGGAAVYHFSGISTQTIDIAVFSEHTLMNVKRNVVIVAGTNTVDMGTLLEGDANGDGIIDISDFTLLAASFMKMKGDAGFNALADFDRNGIVDMLDFTLLAGNFMKMSPVELPADDSIKIGVIIDYSGPAAMAGWLADGVIGFAEWYWNEQQGGIMVGNERRPVEFLKYDNKGQVAVASAAAKKALLDGVTMVTVGGVSNSYAYAVADVTDPAKALYSTFLTDPPIFEDYDWTVGTYINQQAKVQMCADMIVNKLKPKTIGVLAHQSGVDVHLMKDLINAIHALDPNIELVSEQYYPLGVSDFSPYLTGVRYEDPDVLITLSTQAAYISIAKQMPELGGWGNIRHVAFSEAANFPGIEQSPGADGWIIGVAFLPECPVSPGGVAFAEAWAQMCSVNSVWCKKYSPEGSVPLSSHAVMYNPLFAAIKAIELAGSDDRADIAEAARSGNLTFDSPLGRLEIGTDGKSNLPGFFVQMTQGVYVSFYGYE